MYKNSQNVTKCPTSTGPSPARDFASSDNDAQKRFECWKTKDPYPNVDTALLNSADILAYVKATSLIYPFDADKLAGASYDVKIEGDVVYYDEASENPNVPQIIKLKDDGQCFELRPNSIAFVTLQPTFRIPDYLALRFNLKITHIYKGLLLGTGPLVDPGFVGKLSIPLHNLTKNTYRFFKGDELITMEFTKMSTNKSWNSTATFCGHSEQYVPNNINANRNVLQYIHKALQKDRLDSVISSIPAAMQESKNDVKEAKEAAERAVANGKKVAESIEKKASWQAGVSIIAVCALVISVVGFSISALNKANDRYDTLIAQYTAMEKEYSNKIEELMEQVTILEDLVDKISTPDNPGVETEQTVAP